VLLQNKRHCTELRRVSGRAWKAGVRCLAAAAGRHSLTSPWPPGRGGPRPLDTARFLLSQSRGGYKGGRCRGRSQLGARCPAGRSGRTGHTSAKKLSIPGTELPQEQAQLAFQAVVEYLRRPQSQRGELEQFVADACELAGGDYSGISPGDVRDLLRRVLLLMDIGLPLSSIASAAASSRGYLLVSMDGAKLIQTARCLIELGDYRCLISDEPQHAFLALAESHTPHQIQSTVLHLVTLHLSPQQICQLIRSRPDIVQHSVVKVQRPMVRCLGNLCKLNPADVGLLLLKFPRLMSAANTTKVKEVCRALSDVLGLQPAEIGQCIGRYPQLLCLCVDSNLRPTLATLLGEIGLSREQAAHMVCSMPGVLGLSFKQRGTQWLKLRFLEGMMGKGVKELAACPRVLTYSLEQRTAPRVMFMKSLGVDVKAASLDMIVLCSDQRFAERTAGRPLQEFQEFRQTWRSSPEWVQWQESIS